MKISFVGMLVAGLLFSSLVTGCLVERNHPRRVIVGGPVIAPPRLVIRETVVVRERRGTEVVVLQAPPPAPPREVVVVAPSPRHVWIDGNWVWQGGWIWHRGHWELPPQPTAVWVPHRYEPRVSGHVWIAGGWRF